MIDAKKFRGVQKTLFVGVEAFIFLPMMSEDWQDLSDPPPPIELAKSEYLLYNVFKSLYTCFTALFELY